MYGIIQGRNISRGYHLNNQDGVTLIELMVYLVISGMLLGVAVMTFFGQNRTYNRQDVIAETQQNIRGALSQMVPEIRLAGFAPADNGAAIITGIITASQNKLSFDYAYDVNDDGDYDDATDVRLITYDLYVGSDGNTNIGRLVGITATAKRPLAENIDKLRFEYLYYNYNTLTWIWANDSSVIEADLVVSASKALEMIRAVKIIILGSARESAFATTDTTVYKPPLEGSVAETWTTAAGSGQKRLMSVVVQCRNNRG